MSKRDLCLHLLETKESVTTNEFLAAGCGSRFGARIQELRDMGYDIPPAERVRDGQARYKLRANISSSLDSPNTAPVMACQDNGREGGVIHASPSPLLSSGTDGCVPLDRDPVAVSSGRCLNPYEYENEVA